MIGRLISWLRRLERLIFAKRAYSFYLRQWQQLGDARAASQVVATTRAHHLLEILEVPAPRGRIVVLAPHPDDELIGPGGTLIQSLQAGADVRVVYLTSGEPQEKAIREAEAVYIAEKLGFEPVFLGWPVGAIPIDSTAQGQLATAINGFSADIVMMPFVLDDHDDHRRCSQLLLAAFDAALIPNDLSIWAYQVYSPGLANVAVDVTREIATKQQYIRLYHSQMASRDWANFSMGLSAWNSRFLANRPQAAYGELFFKVPLKDYAEICRPYFAFRGDQTYVRHYRQD